MLLPVAVAVAMVEVTAARAARLEARQRDNGQLLRWCLLSSGTNAIATSPRTSLLVSQPPSFLNLLNAAMTPSLSGSSSGLRFFGTSCAGLFVGRGGAVKASAKAVSSSTNRLSFKLACSANLILGLRSASEVPCPSILPAVPGLLLCLKGVCPLASAGAGESPSSLVPSLDNVGARERGKPFILLPSLATPPLLAAAFCTRKGSLTARHHLCTFFSPHPAIPAISSCRAFTLVLSVPNCETRLTASVLLILRGVVTKSTIRSL